MIGNARGPLVRPPTRFPTSFLRLLPFLRGSFATAEPLPFPSSIRLVPLRRTKASSKFVLRSFPWRVFFLRFAVPLREARCRLSVVLLLRSRFYGCTFARFFVRAFLSGIANCKWEACVSFLSLGFAGFSTFLVACSGRLLCGFISAFDFIDAHVACPGFFFRLISLLFLHWGRCSSIHILNRSLNNRALNF